jgi:MoaD family protein
MLLHSDLYSSLACSNDDNSMKILVRYMLSTAQITGKHEEIIEVAPEATIQDLLQVLAKEYGNELGKALPKNEYEMNESILLNGRGVRKTEVKEFLRDNDVLTLVPPVHGG